MTAETAQDIMEALYALPLDDELMAAIREVDVEWWRRLEFLAYEIARGITRPGKGYPNTVDPDALDPKFLTWLAPRIAKNVEDWVNGVDGPNGVNTLRAQGRLKGPRQEVLPPLNPRLLTAMKNVTPPQDKESATRRAHAAVVGGFDLRPDDIAGKQALDEMLGGANTPLSDVFNEAGDIRAEAVAATGRTKWDEEAIAMQNDCAGLRRPRRPVIQHYPTREESKL